MLHLDTITDIMQDHADEIGTDTDLIAWINRDGIETVSYLVWDDFLYGILTDAEIALYLASLVYRSV
jgi:hypothetical protein